MKFNVDKKYIYTGLTALIVLILAILFYYCIFHGTNLGENISRAISICSPIIDGLVIAFLICPLVNWLELRYLAIFCKKQKRSELSKVKQNILRIVTIFLSFIFIISLLTLFAYSISPLMVSIENITKQWTSYRSNIEVWINGMLSQNPEIAGFVTSTLDTYSAELTAWKNDNLVPQVESIAKTVTVSVFNFLGAVWDVLIGAIISVYVVYNKEKFSGQFKKLIYGFIGIKNGNTFIKNIRIVNQKFSGFIVGKLLDSLIIGILCFICCSILRFPYPLLISLIIGVTNIIPFFGPIFGAIPCALLIFMVNPIKCFYFLIFILALQQFDGNILGPKILGVSTGISSFWVIFAITIFGGIWKVPGMIIGVPLFAVIYAAIKTILSNKLQKRGLPEKTDCYIPVDYIDESNQEFVPLVDPQTLIDSKRNNRKDKKKKDLNDK